MQNKFNVYKAYLYYHNIFNMLQFFSHFFESLCRKIRVTVSHITLPSSTGLDCSNCSFTWSTLSPCPDTAATYFIISFDASIRQMLKKLLEWKQNGRKVNPGCWNLKLEFPITTALKPNRYPLLETNLQTIPFPIFLQTKRHSASITSGQAIERTKNAKKDTYFTFTFYITNLDILPYRQYEVYVLQVHSFYVNN